MYAIIQFCRLCTSNKNISSTLFDLDSDGKYFIDKLETIVPEIVDCKYRLPNFLCSVCAVQLFDAYIFIKQCLDAQIILKEHLHEELCRFCASNENISFSLTDKDSDNILFSYKLESIVPEMHDSDDSVTQKICSLCSKRLNLTFKFIDMCFKSQKILKGYVKQLISGRIVDESFENESNSKEKNFDFTESKNIDQSELDKIVYEKKDDKNFECVYVQDEKEILFLPEPDLLPDVCDMTKADEATPNEKDDEMISGYKYLSKTKQYQCTICDRKLKQLWHFKDHLISHTDTRPFKCYICDKGFKRKSNLNAHVYTHSS